MASVSMSQNLNILLLNLARTFPSGKVSVTALGPLSIRNGQVESIGAATKTEIQLQDIAQKEQTPPVPELEAAATYKLAKRANHPPGRRKR